MPVEQLPRRAPRSDDAKLVHYDEYIDRQIQSTRRAVKAVDIATALVTLAAGAIAFLLTVAVVEHWLVPDGFSEFGRSVLFALLLGGAGYFAYRRLWPVVVHSINPVYAAQTIEHSSPSLKNSLINLLLFRGRRTEISDAVYKTLEEQAAQRLTRVPVDTAVDRTQLIRFGYVLLAIVGLAALYKVLSPKDPLVSAERVLLPWADIVPASRVQISNVEPGNVTISRGEFLTVAADVRGLEDSDSVVLRYTTADGQAMGKPIPMTLGEGNLRFECRLPDERDERASVGVGQNLTYRIEAGDARSLDYNVRVVPAPSILVERIDYDYPDYTGFQDRSIEQLGDIRAIEGTRVTVHARANAPIQEAFVDFDADGRRDLTMIAEGAKARASFVLALRDEDGKRTAERRRPEHKSYVLRFKNGDGRPNRNPVKHPIDVVRDYSPEAAFLAPKEKSRDVRLDETVLIEVEARDPDFALSEVRLRGEATGRPTIDEPLLEKDHRGRFTTRYEFTPSAHDLRAGDVVQLWLVAKDNRTPEANSTATDRKVFRIVSPNPAQQPPPDRLAQRDQPRQPGEPQNDPPQNGEQQPQDGQQQPQDGGKQGQQGQAGGQNGEQGQPSRDQAPQPGANQPLPQDNQQQQQDGQGGAAGGNSSNARGNQQQQPQSANQDKRGNQAPSEQQDSNNAPGDASPAGAESGQGGGQNANRKQTGAGAAGGEPNQNGAQPDGARPEERMGNNGAERNSADGQAAPNGGDSPQSREQSPISSEGDNDAEAFERIARHLREKGELKNEAQDGAQDNPSQPGEQRSGDASGDQPGTETDARQRGASPTDKPSSTDEGGAQQNKQGEGRGAETRPDDLPDETKPQTQPGQQQQSPGGEQTASKGESGAGDQPEQSQGTPNSQPGMKPTEKWQQRQSADEQKPDEAEPPAGARGKRESDSQGDQGGDKPGGGEQGGGQKAPREGTGSSGQNQSADEGAGESSERGQGNTSPDAGRDAVADRRTGQPDSQSPGEGSTQRERQQGDPTAGEQGNARREPGDNRATQPPNTDPNDDPSKRNAKPAGEKGDEAAAEGQNQPRSEQSAGGNQPGAATGDSPPRRGTAQPSTGGTTPEGDEANLEYARKQTDLVLEKLAEKLNEKQVDQELLDELGWSPEELQRFVARWQERKRAAQKQDPTADAARRELDEALRSLGLRPGNLQQSKLRDDEVRDLSEGYRGAVPLEYRERLRAYNQGVSRSRPSGE